jgi:hypothetical protein
VLFPDQPAVSALKEKGILSGRRIERTEIGGPGDFDHLTDEELERDIRQRIAELGFDQPAISDGTIINGAKTDIEDHET